MIGYKRELMAAVAALSLAVSPALAHSPYLKPNGFQVSSKRDHVTIEASFAEGELRPDVAMISDQFHLIGPDGVVVKLSPSAVLKDATYLEAPLMDEGTYLISSGVRKGRIAKAMLVGNQLVFIEAGQVAKAGETIVDVQSLTRADVYVTRGKPVKPNFKTDGVELFPITAPYDAYVGAPVIVMVRENGRAISHQNITIIADGNAYLDKPRADVQLMTDANGEVTFTPESAGLYLLQVRVRRPDAENKNLWLSHTATLTLEVLPQ